MELKKMQFEKIFGLYSWWLDTYYVVIWMQYKFFVDGEWRHDEHQPYISGEFGIVNTVLLATDPNFVPVLNPDIASGSNMDVDNEAFRRVVRVSHILKVVIVAMNMALCVLALGYIVLWLKFQRTVLMPWSDWWLICNSFNDSWLHVSCWCLSIQ